MARVDGKRNGDSNLTADRRHYYSSSQGPFYNANNIYLFYGGGDRGAMVDSITHNIRNGKRLTRVEGEPGSGKTMMSLVLADRLNRHFNIIRYDLAGTSRALLLRQLLIELCPSDATLLDVIKHGRTPSDVLLANAQIVVERQLRSCLQAGKPYVLMVDANEQLGSEVIELLTRLSSLEHLGIPAMHVIIFEPGEKLVGHSSPHSWKFNDNEPYQLRRLSLNEVVEFLRHHMLLFDFNRRDQFTRDMAYFVADRSGGVFRSINTIARNAFLIASIESAEQVSMSHLLMAGLPPREKSSTKSGFFIRHRRVLFALFGSCVVACVAALVLLQ